MTKDNHSGIAGAAGSSLPPDERHVVVDGKSGAFTIDTPRTAGGFAESGAHQAGPLRFALDGAAATVWVSSLDGEPLPDSAHLLVTHLTDVQNSGIEYADAELTTLLRWGGLPHLMRNGTARIELQLNANDGRRSAANDDGAPRQMTNTNHSVIAAEGRSVITAEGGSVIAAEGRSVVGGKSATQVFRLSSSGKRLAEVPAAWDAETGRLRFTARTDYDPTAATYLYEIVRQRPREP